ncbi:Galactose transporter [Lachnellula suecica]|uniref:Galactose transporter n=1 Tax=Lachnellula suecica TaxID=602035 RepID=A0A8T9CKM4_9HELO|nr:Galactose transporter [Lachnellula suecica]
MGLFNKRKADSSATTTTIEEKKASPTETPATLTPDHQSAASVRNEVGAHHNVAGLEESKVTPIAVLLGCIASIGGFMFGYESGQISGFLQMSDFLARFGENGKFSAVRQGTIVALLCAGTLVGCLASGVICDKIGRRYTISASAFFYIIGVVIEITSDTQWVQFAMGRFAAGLGIGALSTSVPMYQSESVPKSIRGAVVASYQLLITLGIWTAYMVNWGTEATYNNSAQWRIPNGLSALWAIILGVSILFMPESPRFAYRMGRTEEARKNMGRLNGVDPFSRLIDEEISEIEEKLAAEREGGDHPWHEVFTGPRMLYRTLLGMILQAGQQLTGANFFFYYGTTIFRSTGISNSYITSIILGSVNVAATIGGLWIIKNCGRRISLMVGAAVMCGCFLVYSFVGHFALDPSAPDSTPAAGAILIVFTCIFIAAFATTWGPLVWAVVGELYPARYRASGMALATASNWLMNFLISFFTTFIVDAIDYFYGLVFAGCTFALFWIVYFFMIETKDRSLEEIDSMYVAGVNPITSAKWNPSDLGPEGIAGVGTDRLHLKTGGKDIKKNESAGNGLFIQNEQQTV